MSDILKRDFAPIPSQAWDQIDDQAKRVLKTVLRARRVVDLDGPHGWQHGSLDLGRLSLAENREGSAARWGIRQVIPLIETRVPFVLSRMELDNVSRGCADPDLEPLTEAAKEIAMFEDGAVFTGFGPGQIRGILETCSQPAVSLPREAQQYPQAVSEAMRQLTASGVGGPYALVLAPNEYSGLAACTQDYPPYKAIQEMIGGDIVACSALTGGLLLSLRGGDFQLTVGQDLAVGYQRDHDQEVEFFITESFAFRTIEPTAAVPLKPAEPKK
jgi:uncharacterized linocin/CFP29 family protein